MKSGKADLNKREARTIQAILARDVAWILEQRKVSFNPRRGCTFDLKDQAFRMNAQECGTCLVGAHLLKHQPDQSDQPRDHDELKAYVKDYVAFARDVNITERAAYAIYIGATMDGECVKSHPRASLVAARALQDALDKGWEPSNYYNSLSEYKGSLAHYTKTCEAELPNG